MKGNKVLNKVATEIANNHQKILDDFAKAYLASRWGDYFGKQEKVNFNRLELVMRQDGTQTIYFFRLKRGKLKSI